MIELNLSALIARYKSLSFPIICCCPTTSSKVVGRILEANGDSFFCGILPHILKQIHFLNSSYSTWAIVRITSPAIKSPATGGTNEILPGSALRFPIFFRRFPDVSTGFSLEYSTFRCLIPLSFSSFRITLQSGQTDVFEISLISNNSGCSLFPVPIQLMIGISCCPAYSTSASFAVTVSIASTI